MLPRACGSLPGIPTISSAQPITAARSAPRAIHPNVRQPGCVCSAAASPEPQETSSPPVKGAPILLASHARRAIHKLTVVLRQARLRDLLFGGQALGAPPAALAALAVALPALPGGGFSDLLTNVVFLAGFWAWFLAQFLKIFTKRLKKGVWDVRAIVDSGGMPSSHSALCAGITTAIAMQHGMGSSTFALAIALSSIVMYDAAGVRRHAGKHAEVLNQVIGELLEDHHLSQVQLKEVLGHTPLQVCAGACLGIIVAYWFPYSQFSAPTVAAAAALAAA